MSLGGEFERRSPHGCVWPAGWWRPQASAWAIWSMLCDVNAISARSACTLLGGRGAFSSVFNARAEAPWLLEAHSLNEAQRRDACASAWAFVADAVERRWLRYCTACMAQSYHAACFQHWAVTRCPIHDLPLLDRCLHCGSRVGVTFEAARAAPFGCRACARRLVRAGPMTLSAEQTVAIAATTVALTQSGATMSRIGRMGGGRELTSLAAGHASWWGGVDPFVEGSAWQPHRAWVSVGGRDELDALAWTALIRFVEGRLMDPMQFERILAVADGIERRDRCMAPVRLSTKEMAVAAMVARYGTADYRRARRLLRHGCSATLFPFTPQTSTVVEDSAEANAIVVAAEARDEYMRLAKWIGRNGPRSLLDIDFSSGRRRVAWCFTHHDANRGELLWRAERRHRRRASSTFCSAYRALGQTYFKADDRAGDPPDIRQSRRFEVVARRARATSTAA